MKTTLPAFPAWEIGCDSLGKTFLTPLVGNLWSTGGFWVNSGEGGLISSLFSLEGNAILPMKPQADFAALCLTKFFKSQNLKNKFKLQLNLTIPQKVTVNH